jgi:hypothetical protein
MLTSFSGIELAKVLLTLQELSARLGVGGLDRYLARINLLKP